MKTYESVWMFGCEFGFQQDNCDAYKTDYQSRGYGRFTGCVACCHRVPFNDVTTKAEIAWKDHLADN